MESGNSVLAVDMVARGKIASHEKLCGERDTHINKRLDRLEAFVVLTLMSVIGGLVTLFVNYVGK